MLPEPPGLPWKSNCQAWRVIRLTQRSVRVVGTARRQDSAFTDKVMGDLDTAGVEDLGGSAVMRW